MIDLDRQAVLKALYADFHAKGVDHDLSEEELRNATGLAAKALEVAVERLERRGLVLGNFVINGLVSARIAGPGIFAAESYLPDEVRFERNRDRRAVLEVMAQNITRDGLNATVPTREIAAALGSDEDARLYTTVKALEGAGVLTCLSVSWSWPPTSFDPTPYADEVLHTSGGVEQLFPVDEHEAGYPPVGVEEPAEFADVAALLEHLGWASALEAYREASRQLEAGESNAAVRAVGVALEATLTSFLEARGVVLGQKETLATLREKLPSTFKQRAEVPFGAVSKVLDYLGEARNDAAHGGKNVGPIGAALVRNLAASVIIFLGAHERVRRSSQPT